MCACVCVCVHATPTAPLIQSNAMQTERQDDLQENCRWRENEGKGWEDNRRYANTV